MRKMYLALLICLLATTISSLAQDKKEPSWGINLSGFVKTDVIFDTRQYTGLREGHFLLYPSNESIDKNGDDLTKVASFNIMSIQTRVAGTITAPDALGAKTSAYIEAEFYGPSEESINALRLRHAWIKLDWGGTYLVTGQDWHPLFIREVFAQTVSFNTGAPFQPFSRNPQVRFNWKLSDVNIMLAAVSQRDFQSSGPKSSSDISNTNSTSYARNAIVPEMDMGIQYKTPNLIFGAVGGYKMLKPRTVSITGKKTDETIGSYQAEAYVKINSGLFTCALEGVYGQNMYNLMMLSGYGETIDSTTGESTYTPGKVMSGWVDMYYGKEWQVGLFAGYQKNLGTEDNYTNYYGRDDKIDYLMRVSPRIVYNTGKFRIAGEVEYTGAAYAIPSTTNTGNPNRANKGKIGDTKTIANIRGLIGVFVFF